MMDSGQFGCSRQGDIIIYPMLERADSDWTSILTSNVTEIEVHRKRSPVLNIEA
jgi:hypothetical protein